MKKILAVASVGGHWIQLCRITQSLDTAYDFAYASTHAGCQNMHASQPFHLLEDFSRWNAYKLFPATIKAWRILRKENPDVVITTGAAPGLIIAFVAWLQCKKTIWIDSIANVENLSLCGRLASLFVTRIYTQWPELATKRVIYSGNVLG